MKISREVRDSRYRRQDAIYEEWGWAEFNTAVGQPELGSLKASGSGTMSSGSGSYSSGFLSYVAPVR